MKKGEYAAAYHPDFLIEWKKYEAAYGKDASEKFLAWVENKGLDVEFPLQAQIEARMHGNSAPPQRQTSNPVMPQKQIQGQILGHPVFVGRIADQNSVEKDDFVGYSDYKVIGRLGGKEYFENVAEGWMNVELGPRPQMVGKKHKR